MRLLTVVLTHQQSTLQCDSNHENVLMVLMFPKLLNFPINCLKFLSDIKQNVNVKTFLAFLELG